MTAEEFLVEKYQQLEKRMAEAEEVIEDLHELNACKREEIEQFEKLINLLQSHFSKSASGIHFDFFNVASHKDEIEFLKNFFDLEDEEDFEEDS